MKEKIAIIGGGIAGLTAAYLLNDRYDLTLFEKDSRIGGNAYTLTTRDGNDIDVSVFFFNPVTYPNFYELLNRLGLSANTRPLAGASMTLKNLDTQATRAFNFDPLGSWSLKRFSPQTALIGLSLLYNVTRAVRLLEAGAFNGLTMEEAMKLLPNLKGEASKALLFPLCLMASMHYRELMKAPAVHFMGKLERHFGSLKKALSWRLLNCRTKDYAEALAQNFSDRIVLNSEIAGVGRSDGGVALKMKDGAQLHFNRVVFACPADQALKLLEPPTDEEKRILGVWKYNDGLVVVHQDGSQFPENEMLSLYEYLYTDRDGEIETSINASYRDQRGVSAECRCLGTQYPNFPIQADLIEFQKVFRTPIYDSASMPMIGQLPSLNGVKNTYYCGAHFGYGLHEDAVDSAIAVAQKLGVNW